MANENLFPSALYWLFEMVHKANYFAVTERKNLILSSFDKSRDDPFLLVCRIPHNLFSNGFSHSPLIKFFFIKIV